MSDPIIPVAPAPAAAPAPVPTPPAAPLTVPLTVDEYQRLRGLEEQLSNYHTQEAARAAAAEAEWLEVLAEKEGATVALDEQRKAAEIRYAESQGRYSQLETTVFSERKSAALADALAGRSFVGETPEQKAAAAGAIRSLLESSFETTRDGNGSLVVREKGTGRPATDVLKEKLSQWPYTALLTPDNKGGSGSAPSNAPASQQQPDESQRGSLGEIVKNWQARQQQYGSMGLHGTSKPK